MLHEPFGQSNATYPQYTPRPARKEESKDSNAKEQLRTFCPDIYAVICDFLLVVIHNIVLYTRPIMYIFSLDLYD